MVKAVIYLIDTIKELIRLKIIVRVINSKEVFFTIYPVKENPFVKNSNHTF